MNFSYDKSVKHLRLVNFGVFHAFEVDMDYMLRVDTPVQQLFTQKSEYDRFTATSYAGYNLYEGLVNETAKLV